MDDLTKYILVNYSNLMTIEENMAYRYFLLKSKGHIDKANTFTSNILGLIEQGEENFYESVRDRLLQECKDKIFLNYCPKCGHITRTPKANQCLTCKYDWHCIHA